MTVIGGADGPTSIFVTSGMGWLNLSGLIIIVLMLAPNILYALRHRDAENRCASRLISFFEQIGRYGCMFLMVFNVGIAELGFRSAAAFLAYLCGSAVLLIAYYAFWLAYGKRQSLFAAIMLAVLPTLLFLLSGLTMRHWLLVGFSVLFGVAHIYITVMNARKAE